MQISRHWRLNSQRYRLQGVKYENGKVSLQIRPTPPQSAIYPSRADENKPSEVHLKVAS
jgi:hypothetical protein